MAKLKELITHNEITKIKRANYEITVNSELLNSDLLNLTWKDLTTISFALMQTEYPQGTLPQTVLAAESIKILTQRAIDKNIPIY